MFATRPCGSFSKSFFLRFQQSYHKEVRNEHGDPSTWSEGKSCERKTAGYRGCRMWLLGNELRSNLQRDDGCPRDCGLRPEFRPPQGSCAAISRLVLDHPGQ